MFIIQPGQGLGFTGSREIALALGGAVAAAPPLPPVVDEEPTRGSGPTHGIRKEGYKRHRESALLETRRRRILQEDEEIIALILSMITKDLM